MRPQLHSNKMIDCRTRRSLSATLLPLCVIPGSVLSQPRKEAGDAKGAASHLVSARDRISFALAEMQRPHELIPGGVPVGVGWRLRPGIGMGTEPYASNVRPWWPGIRFAQWKAMLSWFTVYEAEGGSPARNVAVEINGIEMWFLSASDLTWKRLQSGAVPSWRGGYASNAIDRAKESVFSSPTATGIALAPTRQSMVHGGLGQVATPWRTADDQADLAAVFVSVRHRLVKRSPDGSDDRSAARLVVQAGADYYPHIGARVADLGATYVPSVALGRFVRSAEAWRYSLMLVHGKSIDETRLLSGLPVAFDY